MLKVSILLALTKQFATVLYPWQQALPPQDFQASGRHNRNVNQKLFLRNIRTLSFPTSAVVTYYRSGLPFSANLLRTYLCHLLASSQVHHKCKDVCLVMVTWRCKNSTNVTSAVEAFPTHHIPLNRCILPAWHCQLVQISLSAETKFFNRKRLQFKWKSY